MKNHTLILLLLLSTALSPELFAQNVAVNATGTMPDTSAMLDVSSSSKGFLMPRMTTAQQNAIILPATGLAIFNTTLNSFQVNTGTPLSPVWASLTTSLTANAWSLGGNSVPSVQNIGTTSNFDFPFITNNTEKMRLSAGGNLGIGTAVTDGVNAEKLLVDAGTGTYNVISGRGNNPNYLQLNIKNVNNGNAASSDVVATNDAGTEANQLNYVDMGINSSTYNLSTFNITGASDAYLYTTGNDFAIGNATSTKSLKFFTGGTLLANERMRIDGVGNVGIGVNSPTALLHLKAGTVNAGTAPLKFISGALLTTAEPGAVEYLTDKFYGTTSTAGRKEFTLNETTGLVNTRIPFANAGGRLTDLANFTYNSNRLSPTYITLGAGTTTAGTAPLVFTSGPLLAVPVAGSVEFNGTHFFATVGSTQYQLDQQVGTAYTGSNGITLVSRDIRNNLITGIAGGQTVIGGTATGNSLTLSSTSNATKGKIIFGSSAYDEVNNRLGIANAVPTEKLDIAGNVKFSGALMPNNQPGSAGSFLTSNGAGNSPTWSTAISGTNTGDVTIGATPNGLSLAGQVLSLGLSGTGATGALSATDWNTFNTKGSGSVTSIASGFGLLGGTITTAGTLSADSATLSNYYLRRKDSAANGGYYPYATNPKNYLTGNQTITLSGDVTGSGTGVIPTSLATVNTNTGTWNNVTINAKGLATAGSNIAYLTTIDTSNIPNFYTKVRSLFSATAPITYSNGLIGITQSTTGTDGYLSSTDWNTFNNKASAYTSGNLTESGSSVLTITGGAGAVLGSGTAVQVKQANGSQNGFLSSGDWTTFNTKQNALTVGNVTGSDFSITGGTGAVIGTGLSLALAAVNANIGTWNTVTVNNKGLVTAGSNISYLTGNQTITFASTGDISSVGGSGATSLTPALTIGANKVTLAQMAQVASGTFLGRTTGGNGNVEAMTTAQAKTLLGIGGNNNGDVTLAGENYLSLTGQIITANRIDLSGTNVNGTLAAARFPALTGDVTNTVGTLGTTIASGAVTNTKLATMAANTFKANATGSVASPTDITGTDATAMLNNFTPTLKGLAPLSGGGTSNFLRADGTWAAPSTANQWSITGNSGTTAATNFIGTTDAAGFRIKVNTTAIQGLLVDSLGNVAVGAAPVFTALPAREKFLVDAGSTSSFPTPTGAFNVISGKGYLNNYLQLNIQNNSPGTLASSDIVASNDLATESANYIDMGINSSGNTSTGVLGGIGTAYLYSTGNDFVIGNSTANKPLRFYTTNAGAVNNEAMRIDPDGNLGIGNLTPTQKLDVTGNMRFSGALMPNNLPGAVGNVLISGGSNAAPTWSTALSGTNTGDVTIGTANGLSLAGQVLSLGLSGASTTGALSSADWTIFNAKQPQINGTGFVKSTGTTISYDNSTYLTANQTITFASTGDISSVGGSGATSLTPALTIGANKVTLAQMAQVASGTFLGRTTGGNGNVEAMTTAQAKTLLGIGGNNNGDVTLAGENYLSLTGQIITANRIDLSGTNVNGTLAAARFPALTGDVTNTVGTLGTTIASGAVTNTKLATMAANTFKANATGSVASPTDINGTVATTLLDNFTATTKGLVPLSGGGISNFLRADGTWQPVSTTAWGLTGNTATMSGTNFIGTTDNAGMKFKTFGIQRMLVDSLGSIGIGTSPVFAAGTAREKFLVDAGTTTSINAISARGTIDSYFQLNIQNKSATTGASSDIVATSDNGDESNGFVNLGINSSAYNVPAFNLGGANDAYLYSVASAGNVGGNLTIGTGSSGKIIKFHTGGTTTANERMRIDGSGNVGIGTTSPATALQVNGTNPLTLSGVQLGTATTLDSLLTIRNGTVLKLPISGFSGGSSWALTGNTGTSSSTNFLGTSDAQDLVFKANNTEKLRLINGTSQIQIGNADSGVIKSTKELVMREDGDQFGPSILRLRNRNGENGAIFETVGSSAALVDFLFKTGTVATPVSSNIRFEARSGSATKVTGNTTEWQIGQPDVVNGGPTLAVGAFGTGSNSALLIGNFGIGNTAPSQKLDVTGNIKFSGTLMPNNLPGTAGTFLTSNGASTAPTWTAFDTANIPAFSTKVRSLFSATAPVTYANGLIGITQASTSTDGYLSSTDWTTFNNKATTAGSWSTTGNSGTDGTNNFIGTTDNVNFNIITNNTKKLIIDAVGNVTIGSPAVFSAKAKTEKFLVDAGFNAGNPTPVGAFNVISGRGYLDNYLQLNIQNFSPTASASSDIVASNDAATELINYVNMGINSSGNTSTGVLGGFNTAYLYSTGNDFVIGNASPGKILSLFTAGTASSNERMRIDSNGNVGIGTTNPLTKLHVYGTNPLTLTGVQTGTTTSADSVLTISGGLVRKLPVSTFAAATNAISSLNGLTATIQTFATGTTGTDFNIGTSGTTIHTFNLPDASAANRGLITIGAQTIAGNKTLSGNTTVGGTFGVTGASTFTGAITATTLSSGASTDSIVTASGSGLLRRRSLTDLNTGSWSTTGNTGTTAATNYIGTKDARGFRIKVNTATAGGYQGLLVDSLGNVAVGNAPVFSTTLPTREKFLVDAGVTTSVNAITARGSINNYLQFNIQNQSAATNATSDIVATADNGTDSTNYVDLGINGSNYAGSAIQTGVANDGYLISAGNDFYMVNSSANKSMLFLTGGTGVANERMRILANGRVGMGVQNPTAPFVVKDTMEIRRVGSLSQLLFTNTASSGDFRIGGDGGDLYWQGGGGRALQMGSYWTTILGGDRQGAGGPYPGFVNGTGGTGVSIESQRDASVPLAVKGYSGTQSANLTEWRNSAGTVLSAVDKDGNLGLGLSNPSAKLHVVGTNPLTLIGVQTGSSSDSLLTIIGGIVKKVAPSTLPVANAWALTGNATTNPSSNFLGTTDAQPLLFKVNNQQIGRLEQTSFAFGAGAGTNTATNSLALGYGAVLGSGIANAMSIGSGANATIGNTFAIGNSATSSPNNGDNAFAIGNAATVSSTASFAIGPSASTAASISNAFALGKSAIVNGSNAMAIGNNASVGTGGTSAVAIGDGAQANGISSVSIGTATVGTGSTNSVAIGTGASIGASLTNSTAIGANASTTLSNTLILGDRGSQLLSVGIGSELFSPSTREKLLVDAGTVVSNGYINVIGGKGITNNYMQVNLQNGSNGSIASSDFVATNDAGTELNQTGFVDMGINSSGNTTTGVLGGNSTAYLYSTGNDFVIGNNTASKPLRFYTANASGTTTEAMRIDGNGYVGINSTAPDADLTLFQRSGTTNARGFRFTGNSIGGTNSGTGFNLSLGYNVVNNKQLWLGDADYVGNPASTFFRYSSSTGVTILDAVNGNNTSRKAIILGVAGDAASGVILGSDGSGTSPASYVWSNGNMAIGNAFRANAAPVNGLIVQGNVGIGATTLNATYPEKLLVDAGASGNTNFQNVIVGKGNTNSYAQLNIQNSNAGTGASSDVVATADNGDEAINFIDMGINSSGNTAGIMGVRNDAYLYNQGNNLFIGTGTANKSLIFTTGGTDSATNERMRIGGTGNVGIGTISAGAKLDVAGTFKLGTAGSVFNNMIRVANISNATNPTVTTATSLITLAVPGAIATGSVIVNPRSLPSGIVIAYARVSAADVVTVGLTSTGSIALGTVIFDVTVIQ